jgi:hypothetical protein
VEHLSVEHDNVLAALDLALDLTIDIQRAYLLAGPQERRLFNQGIYKSLEIDDEQVADVERAKPFDQLASLAQDWNGKTAEQPAIGTEATATRKAKTSDPISEVGGLNVESLVELGGFEPPTS